MSSKAQKLRNKRAAKAAIQSDEPIEPHGKDAVAIRTVAKRQSMKPTAERKGRGVWVDGKDAQPDVDLASDMAGSLFQERKISAQQLEVAHRFSEVRAAYVAEFEVPGYKSCLAGGVGGHDGGDGNPAVVAEYKRMTRNMTPILMTRLIEGLEAPAYSRWVNVPALCVALDAIDA